MLKHYKFTMKNSKNDFYSVYFLCQNVFRMRYSEKDLLTSTVLIHVNVM